MTKLAIFAALLWLGTAAARAEASAGATSPPVTSLDNTSGTLSKKLSDTNGVIAPKRDVDPDMHKPAPQTGSMPVITPGTVGDGVAK